MNHEPIPSNHPVQPLKDGENPKGKTTCGHCGLSWDDDKPTSLTPAPSARCPFEYFHKHEPEPSGMKIQTCRFINVTDVFDGFADIKKHFDQGDNYDFSWGDNNRSMIDGNTLIDALDQMISPVPADEITEQAVPKGMSQATADEVFLPSISEERWEAFRERIASIPNDVYIDLEN